MKFVDPFGLCGSTDPKGCWDDATECVGNNFDCITEPIEDARDQVSDAMQWCVDNLLTCGTNAVQIADLAPIPGPVGWIMDTAAAIAAEISILNSSCSAKEKLGLSLINAANLAIGLGANGLDELVDWGTTTSKITKPLLEAKVFGVETTLYVSGTIGASRCGKE